MDINWNKWAIENLPFRFRTKIMSAYCISLVSPVQVLYEEVDRWQAKMKTKAGGSPQVCMMQKVVKDTLGIDIVILEGDGKPTDFIIQTAFTDTDKERQLFALLDYYKLAGKSYSYENKQVACIANWTDYVCEKGEVTFNQQWSKYVCEKGNGDRINNITITYYWKYDAEWNTTIMKRMSYEAATAVQSDLIISCDMYVLGHHDSPLSVEHEFKTGQYFNEMNTWVMDKHANEKVFPGADYYFNYKLIIKDVYE